MPAGKTVKRKFCGMIRQPLRAAIALLALSAPSVASAATNRADIADGRAIARAQCSGCHAIGRHDHSPRADAPPLRHVLRKYDPNALTEDLREGIKLGHPDMPKFELGPRGADSLLAYLRSIQSVPKKKPPR
jgi:mono/diheme cytochrome c family protein